MSRRAYPKYKPSGVEWLDDVPEHWRIKPLKRTFTILNGSTPKSGEPDYWDGDVAWATPDDLGSLAGNTLRVTRRTITQEGYDSCGTTLAPAGSLVLSTRAPIGYLAIAGIPLSTNQGCRCLVFCEDAQNRFYYYLLLSAKLELESWGQGSTFKELGRDRLATVYLVSPPLDEQRAIAAFLDRETARIDALIEKKQRQIELLQEKRAALISHTVTKGLPAAAAAQAGLDPNVKMKDSGIEWLGQIPEHWDAIPVKRRYGIQLGKMLQNNPESDTDVSVPYAKALHVRWGKVDTSDLPDMWASPSEVKHFGVKSGDLLVCEGGEAGRAGIVDSAPAPCIIQNALHRVRGKGTDVRFLQYVLQTVGSGGWFDVLCNKATIAHFTREKLAELRVPMPVSLAEQLSIDAFLDRETARIDALIEKINSSINLLREYRTALISAAVTGKIDVREEVA